MNLTSYDRLFPSQDVHTGRGMGNLIAAPLNGNRRQHGTTLFLDPATLEPFDDQWAYLSSIARLSHQRRDVVGAPTTRTADRPRRPAACCCRRRRGSSPAGAQSSVSSSRPHHIDRGGSGSSDDLGGQTRRLDPQPRILRPPTCPPKYLGHTAVPLHATTKPSTAISILPRGLLPLLTRPRRIGRQHTAHRRRPRPGHDTQLHLRDRAATKPDHRPAATLARHSVLIAPPGSGKTVIACAAIESRRRPPWSSSTARRSPINGATGSEPPGVQMRPDRRWTVEDDGHPRHALLPTLARREQRRRHHRRTTDSSSLTNVTMSPPAHSSASSAA